MKKLLSILLATIMVVGLVGCGSKSEDTSNNSKDYSNASLEEIKKDLKTVNDGKLTVATSPDFAPYEFYSIDDNGDAKLAGFDMALAQFIADYLGLELDVKPMDFDGTIADLANKKVDISLAGYSPDPKREDKMDFSDIYFESTQSFVTVDKNASKFKDLKSTSNKDFTIAAQTGSIQLDLAKENSKDANIIEVTKVTDIISQLIAGKADGAYIEKPVAEAYKINYPELNLLFDVPYEGEGSVVGVSKGNSALLAGINMAIKEALDSGKMDEFIKEANEKALGNIKEGLLED